MKPKKPRNGSTVEPSTDDPIDQRLARIEGQVIGIRKMQKNGRSCVEILTQLSAIQAALDQVKINVLKHHVSDCPNGEGCLGHSLSDEEKQNEIATALNRFVK